MACEQIKSIMCSGWFTFIFRTASLMIFWWWLTGDDLTSWWVGLPVCLMAAFVSIKIFRPSALIRFSVVPRFLVFFFKYAIVGSIDIAKRALNPTLPINPANIHYLTCLPSGAVKMVFIAVLGLLPGTLCVAKEGRHLLIHVIDADMDTESELRLLETLIAELFGVERMDE